MRISKYNRHKRFAQNDRGHWHGWAGWQSPRLKRLGKRKDLTPPADLDNWEDDVKVLDYTDHAVGVSE